VPPEDVDALAAAVTRLAADPGRRAALAARGRPYVAERFDRKLLAARYLEVLEAAVRGTSSAAL
jgi:glycosyltransferase involved in cell wall biosynthesis